MKKCNVLIIYGGISNEHEISVRSSKSILEYIDREKFDVTKLYIEKSGKQTPCILAPDPTIHGVIYPDGSTKWIDVIFPIVHGQNCEDGALQGLMKMSGIPFVGPGILAASTTFDKAITHEIAEHFGYKMAKWQCIKKGKSFENKIGYPCFVKPCNSGSSVGCSRVDKEEDLPSALSIAFKEDSKVLIEELILAHEVECGVMGNGDTLFAPYTGEIVTPNGFYDYDTKYKTDEAKLYIPATITQELSEKICSLAKKIYESFDLSGLARIDFFVKDDGEIILNEINTIPGFTDISMFPKMMMKGGYTFTSLITKLIELALEGKK